MASVIRSCNTLGDVMKIYSIRLCEDQVAAIDAGDVSRSDFIREAIGAALAGAPKKNSIAPPDAGPDINLLDAKRRSSGRADPEHVDDDGSETSFNKPKVPKKADPAVLAVKAAVSEIEPSAPVRRVSSVPSPRAQDILDVVAVIRSGRYSSNMAERALGLPGLRYANAEKALLASGKAVVEGGVLVVSDE